MKMTFGDSDFLKAEELDGEQHVTIKDVDQKEFDNGTKYTVGFHETPKRLVLNVTNGRTIADVYTNESNNWPGKPVVLYATKTDFGGRMVDAIRVRIPTGAEATAPAPVVYGQPNPAAQPQPAAAPMKPALTADDIDKMRPGIGQAVADGKNWDQIYDQVSTTRYVTDDMKRVLYQEVMAAEKVHAGADDLPF